MARQQSTNLNVDQQMDINALQSCQTLSNQVCIHALTGQKQT